MAYADYEDLMTMTETLVSGMVYALKVMRRCELTLA